MIAFTSCNQYFYKVFAFELLVYNTAWIQDSLDHLVVDLTFRGQGKWQRFHGQPCTFLKESTLLNSSVEVEFRFAWKNYRLKIW